MPGTPALERASAHRTSVANVIELVADSPHSWEDAAQRAVSAAAQTIRHIQGLELINMTANVRDGRITEYKVDVNLAFGVEDPAEPR